MLLGLCLSMQNRDSSITFKLIAPAVIAGMAAAGSAAGNYLSTQSTNAANLRLWHLNNSYNTPAAQMQRFKDAGLNPNLMYQQGNSGNSASAPEFQKPPVDLDLTSSLSQISQYQDFKLKQAQVDNVKAQTDQTREAIINLIKDQTLKDLTASKLGLENNYLSGSMAERIRANAIENWSKLQGIQNAKTTNELNRYNLDVLAPLNAQRLATGNQQAKYNLDVMSPLQASQLSADTTLKKQAAQLFPMEMLSLQLDNVGKGLKNIGQRFDNRLLQKHVTLAEDDGNYDWRNWTDRRLYTIKSKLPSWLK